MTMHFSPRTVLVALVASVSIVLTLSACSYAKRQWDDLTNDRPAQSVEGARRMPILNTQAPENMPEMSAQASRQSGSMPMTSENTQTASVEKKSVPTYDESPYDYFDNAGNRVEPEELQNMPEPGTQQAAAAPKQEEEGFFSRLSGLFGTESSEVKKLREQPRKPISGNSYAPLSLHEPVKPGPVGMEPAVVMPADEAIYPVRDAAHDMPADKSMISQMETAEKNTDKNWFERTVDDIGSTFSSDKNKGANQAVAEEEYPQLTSVPPKPLVAEEIQENKARKMQELQDDLAVAKQDQKALYNEPSSLDAMVPMEKDTAPAMKQDKAGTFHPSQALKEDELLLGHISDGEKRSAPKPQPMPMAEEPKQEMATEEKSEFFWEDWNLFSDKQEDKKMLEERSVPAVAVTTKEPESVKPLVSDETAPASGDVSVIVSAPSKIKEDRLGTVEELMSEEDKRELPSLEVLHQVKTLPPSRYIGRTGN